MTNDDDDDDDDDRRVDLGDAGFSAQRQIVHGFSMTCETYAMAG